jgi:uncharacterized membrane protein YsdA (DUF1294 family)
MVDYLLYYILVVNLIGLYLMYVDKRKARKNQYRISERMLWTVALLGGALGATAGMHWFRHKTKHTAFKWGLPTLTLLDIGILSYALFS